MAFRDAGAQVLEQGQRVGQILPRTQLARPAAQLRFRDRDTAAWARKPRSVESVVGIAERK